MEKMLPSHKIIDYIKNLTNEEIQVQPAGIDLTVEKIFVFKTKGTIGFDTKVLPETIEVPLKNNVWRLPAGFYKVRYNEVVEVPSDSVGLCFPRSSLLRIGATVNCAVWDPGYKGRGESLLIVGNPNGIVIEKNARLVQIIFIKLVQPPSKIYSGTYQNENL